MKEVVPKLIGHATSPAPESISGESGCASSHKRVLESSDAAEPPSSRPRTEPICEVL